ncbi:uncharacterized protein N7473_011101 [Penicillium subrubescens]|uniref:Uncharacterized protein n=1 Tax=Penicillium subrubescens TaxID=1316194 RepID=A0A1Q5U809_9EURO|nr:uncharacterized protein N7473_011101 [Penicillium subrubescens]KAJ5882839.1 hypothetical protein N7473_011101 [Penicillium subrubescens]OKP08620.1 hypothetical protein PENSUB_5533 [Penicillium subrubescens]
MPQTATIRSHPFNSHTPPSISSARPAEHNADLDERIKQLDSRVFELQSTVLTKDGYVDRRNREDDHIRREMETQRATSHLIDLNVMALRSDVAQINSRLDSVDSRLDSMASHMRLSDRVRFNSLAHTISAPISSVPVITESGALEWPKYFPRTVWKFWCLKNRNRVHRLVELAEFYQLGGYKDWSRMQQTDIFADSDSSDSSDESAVITREEAVRRFPETAHRVLAATLGLVYYKIRNEVGEGPDAMPSRPLKRQHEKHASASPRSNAKHVKMPRTLSVSDTYWRRLINGTPVPESQSSGSEELDELGWNPFSDVSEDAMSKLRSIEPQDIGAVLRALEQGRLKLKPSNSEKAGMSPAETKASKVSHGRLAKSVEKSDVPTEPQTPTQPISSPSRKAKSGPETACSSNLDSATT